MANLVCIITGHNNKLIKYKLLVRRPYNANCNCFDGHMKRPKPNLKEACCCSFLSPTNTKINRSSASC